MPDGDALFALGRPVSSKWPARENAPQPEPRSGWRLGRWFARRPPTLFQRCLAVHIYNASKQTSLH